MAKPTTYALAAVAAVLLIALVNGGGKRAPKEDPEDALFRDPLRAGPEIDRRLAQSLRLEDGLVIVKDPLLGDLDLVVLPAPPSWALHCGLGLTITFARSAGGEASADDAVGYSTAGTADAQIMLTTALLDDKTCAVLAPVVGAKIRAILRPR